MDMEIAGWIIEFLLRQSSLDDRLLNDLIRVLPLSNNNPSLKKSLILRKIKSDIEKGTISERTLEFLEQIEELDHREGNDEVSEAMKAAYCTVAVYCTAKRIEESAGDKWEYFNAVRRIWSGRIREMERFDVARSVGLVSDDLLSWMNEIEAGVCDVSVFENVLAKFKGLDVSEVVGCYVDEAKEKTGPSFLELVSETALSDDALRKIMGLNKDEECNDVINDRASTARKDVDPNANGKSKDAEACRANVIHRHKHIATRCPRGAKIADTMETSRSRYDCIPSPEVNKAQEALVTSSFELHAVVKDPLPDALRLAESFKANMSGENTACDYAVGNFNGVNVEAPSSSNDRNHKGPEAQGEVCRDQNKRPKFSLMERNCTAHTVEWTDSIDSSEDGSPTRPHLPSPKKRPVSPLSMYKLKNLPRKRKKKRWTIIEEDTLRTGVKKYGKGSWKLILTMYRNIFEDRTEVDLKDKWRNLMR